MRFEPGEVKTVTLVSLGGHQSVTGGNDLFKSAFGDVRSLKGRALASLRKTYIQKVVELGFAHKAQSDLTPSRDIAPFEISRDAYAGIYGPTTGDRVRLADSPLWIQVEADLTHHGDELKFGGGNFFLHFTLTFALGVAPDKAAPIPSRQGDPRGHGPSHWPAR